MKKILLMVAVFFVFKAQSQVTVENFNYGSVADTLTNPIIGGSLWKRHSGTGGPITYNASSLSYAGYSSSGIGGSISILNASGSREDANLETSVYNSSSVYASFILNVTAGGGTTGDYFLHFLDSSGTTAGSNFRGRVFVRDGSVAGTFKIGISKGSAAVNSIFTTTDYPLNTPVLMVLKYTFNPSFNDSVYGYIFTSGVPSVEPTPTLTTVNTTDIAISDLSKVKSIAIRQGTVGTAAITIDGIRVSNTWASAPLPVKYISFEANVKNKQTFLNWATSSEINNQGFEIQKSTDGVNFETIGFVKGAGNTNTVTKYSFSDIYELNTYFRLKQIDFDGKFEYSDVIAVEELEMEVQLTPNPFTNNIEINSDKNILSAEIVDITGKIRMAEVINGMKASFNTANLSNGVYFLKVNNGEKIITKKIIKN